MLEEMSAVRADSEHQPVFVAEDPNGGLCGLMEVAIHTSAPGCTTQRVGYLEAWYVDPAWRKQGIGRRLVAAAESWAIMQGCREMASDTNQGYPVSPTAHAQLGYETVVCLDNGEYFLRKDLGTPLTPPCSDP